MATLDLSSGRLWATAALATLTVRTAWALGRAVHSAGLAGPPPWPNGRVPVIMCDAFQRLPRAPSTRVIRSLLQVAAATQGRATGQGIDADDQ